MSKQVQWFSRPRQLWPPEVTWSTTGRSKYLKKKHHLHPFTSRRCISKDTLQVGYRRLTWRLSKPLSWTWAHLRLPIGWVIVKPTKPMWKNERTNCIPEQNYPQRYEKHFLFTYMHGFTTLRFLGCHWWFCVRGVFSLRVLPNVLFVARKYMKSSLAL